MAASSGFRGSHNPAGRAMAVATRGARGPHGIVGTAEHTSAGGLDDRLLSRHLARSDLDQLASTGSERWAAVRPDRVAGVAFSIFSERFQFPESGGGAGAPIPDVAAARRDRRGQCFGITAAAQRSFQFRWFDQSRWRPDGAL